VRGVAAVAAVLLLVVTLVQMQLWSLDDKIAQLTNELNTNKRNAKVGEKPLVDVAKLNAFAANDVVWLDEPSRTSQKFPGPDAARVTELTADSTPKGGSHLKISGNANKSETRFAIEGALTDHQHSVHGTRATYDLQAKGGLPWKLDEDVEVLPEKAVAAKKPAPKISNNRQGTPKSAP